MKIDTGVATESVTRNFIGYTNGDSYYFSFLVERTDMDTGPDWKIALADGSDEAIRFIDDGNGNIKVEAVYEDSSNYVLSSSTTIPWKGLNLVVARVEDVGIPGEGTLSIWINPLDLQDVPSGGAAAVLQIANTVSGQLFHVNRVSLTGSANQTGRFDEFRLASGRKAEFHEVFPPHGARFLGETVDLVYYVDPTTGDNGNDGLSPATPFETLAYAQFKATLAMRSGTSVKISLAPATYRQSEIVRFFGENEPLAYQDALLIIEGSGQEPEDVLLTGAISLPGSLWTDEGGGIYSHAWNYDLGPIDQIWPGWFDLPYMACRTEMVLVNGIRMDQRPVETWTANGASWTYSGYNGPSALDASQTFGVSEVVDNRIYLRPGPGVDMATAEIEVAVHDKLLNFRNKNNVIIRNLKMACTTGGVAEAPLTFTVYDTDSQLNRNIKIENCEFSNNNGTGLLVNYSDFVTLEDLVYNENGWKGAGGTKLRGLHVQDNEGSYNCWRSGENGIANFDPAGLKLLHLRDAWINNHVAVGNSLHGIWLDSNCNGVEVTSGYFVDNTLEGTGYPNSFDLTGGIYCERNYGPVMIEDSYFEGNTIGVHTGKSSYLTLRNNIIYYSHLWAYDAVDVTPNESKADRWDNDTLYELKAEYHSLLDNLIHIEGTTGTFGDPVRIIRRNMSTAQWGSQFLATFSASGNIYYNPDETLMFDTDDNLNPETDFPGWISGTVASGEELNSQWRYAAPPDDLTGLSASMNPQLTGIDVTLSANRSQGASSYEIYRSVEGGALNLFMVEPDPGSGSSFSVLLEDEPAESEITYRVVPVNVIKDSPLIEGEGGFQEITETTPAVLTGSIVATVSAQTDALTDLTASGYDDWCIFGWFSALLQNRKAGANLIGDYYLINATTADLYEKRYTNDPIFDHFSWSDGVLAIQQNQQGLRNLYQRDRGGWSGNLRTC